MRARLHTDGEVNKLGLTGDSDQREKEKDGDSFGMALAKFRIQVSMNETVCAQNLK